MCGRYVIISQVTEIEKRFNISVIEPEKLVPRANVSIGQRAPVISSDAPMCISWYTFGLTPHWAEKRTYFFNARAEGDHNKEDNPAYTGSPGIISKPAFRQAIRTRRCLVIADAFIEGPKAEKLSKPFAIYPRDGERPFALAGIWDDWANRATGEIERSFAIITTAANSLMQRIGHHRGPVILERDEEAAWLRPDAPLADVTAMLRPFSSERMNAYPIGPEIKHPAAEGMHLLTPIGQRVVPEYSYEIHSDVRLFGMGESPAKDRRAGKGFGDL